MNKIILAIGIFLIVYYIVLTLVMGPIVFSVNLLILGIVCICWFGINKIFKDNRFFKKFKSFMKPAAIFTVVIFIAVEGIIAGFSFVKNTDETDYLIVLGAGLRGETMTLTLHQRMEASADYLKKFNNCKYIVVSGGQGPGESISEAEAMKRYLISQGISEDRILKEDKSTNTLENLEFSKTVIENHSKQTIENAKVKIATSNFHSLRANILAKELGYKNITSYSCPINPIFIPTYYMREFLALIKTVIFDVILA